MCIHTCIYIYVYICIFFFGISFDTGLTMELAINEIVAKAHVRVTALLRARQFFSPSAIVRMYKMQVLSYVEYATPAISHAPRFFLQRLDDVQTHFLEEIHLSPQDALVNFNLAPLPARRDIAMRGVLGKGPGHCRELFRLEDRPHFPRSLRMPGLRHNRQLLDPIDGGSSNFIRRSALSMIYVHNLLPQAVVDRPNASRLRGDLQKGLRSACEDGRESWEGCLNGGARFLTVAAFQHLFV